MTKTVINNWDKLPVILDLNTVALIFGVTEVTIKKLLYNGELKGKKLGKKWVFDKEYIKNYAQVQSDKAVWIWIVLKKGKIKSIVMWSRY